MKIIKCFLVVFVLLFSINAFADDAIDKSAKKQIKKTGVAKDYFDLENQYKSQRQNIEDAAKNKAWDLAYKKASSYLKEKGLNSGYSTIKQINKHKGKLQALNYLETLYKSDNWAQDIGSQFFEDYAEEKILEMVTYIIPSAKLCYQAGKIFHNYIKGLDAEIYNSNSKTLISMLLKDKQIWSMNGKQRDDYFLSNYLGVNPVTMIDTRSDSNTIKIRAFFYEHGVRLTGNSKDIKKTIGWEEKSWLDSNRKSLHQQRTAILYIFRNFLYKNVKPIRDKEMEQKRYAKLLREQISALKYAFTNILSESQVARIKSEEEVRLKYEWMENQKKLNKYQSLRKQVSVSTPKVSTKQKDYNKAADLFESRKKQLEKIDASYIKVLKQSKSINHLNVYIPDEEAINSLDADQEIVFHIASFMQRDIFKSILGKIYFSDSYSKSLDNFEKNISEKVSAIEGQNSELESRIENYQTYITSVKRVKYVNHTSFDNKLFRLKQGLINKINNNINSFRVTIARNDDEISKVSEGRQKIASLRSKVDSYNSDLESFNTSISSLLSAQGTLLNFRAGKMDNLNALSREKKRWFALMDSVYDSVKILCGSNGVTFPFTKEDLESRKMETDFLDKAYVSYYRYELDKYLRKIKSDNALNKKVISQVSDLTKIQDFNYPLYENRQFFMPQSDVDSARKDFEKNFKEYRSESKKEMAVLDKYFSVWSGYKKGLLEMEGAYLNQNVVSQWTPYSSISKVINKYDNNKTNYELMLSKYKKEQEKTEKRIRKQKGRRFAVDKKEADRFFVEYSRRQLFNMDNIQKKQFNSLTEYKESKKYFPVYLATDIGKAKTLYLYLFSKMNDVTSIHNDASELLRQKYTASDKAKAVDLFSQETDFFLEMKSTVIELRSSLQKKFKEIEQLELNAHKIDINEPMEKIIYGQMDSDHDGFPDNVELSSGTDPTDGSSTNPDVIVGTHTLSVSTCFNVASNAFESWSATSGQIYVESTSSLEITAKYYNMTGQTNMPDNPAVYIDGGHRLKFFSAGETYALLFDNGLYGKLEILNISGSSITVKHWYNPKGGTF